jgi:hypothetical protein
MMMLATVAIDLNVDESRMVALALVRFFKRCGWSECCGLMDV